MLSSSLNALLKVYIVTHTPYLFLCIYFTMNGEQDFQTFKEKQSDRRQKFEFFNLKLARVCDCTKKTLKILKGSTNF